MTILAFIFWVVIALFASGIVTHRKDTQSKNKVRFYVARDKTHNLLWLYLGKPIRFKDDAWLPGKHGTVINTESSFEMIGLNKKDYDNLKWEDEPVEVFLNLED